MRASIGAVAVAVAAMLAVGPATTSPAEATTSPATATTVPAGASTKTWTVHPGGTITATAGTTTLTDTPTGSMVPCASSRLTGTLKAGRGLNGTGIGSITTAVFKNCAAAGFAPTVTARGLSWQLSLISYDARTGVTRGTISHLQLAVDIPEFGCTAAINGTSGTTADGVAAVSYANKTDTLKILSAGSDLHWYHVHSCAGVVRNGDPATLSARYKISPAQTITSP